MHSKKQTHQEKDTSIDVTTLKNISKFTSTYQTSSKTQSVVIPFDNHSEILTTLRGLINVSKNNLQLDIPLDNAILQDRMIDVINVLQLAEKLLPETEMEFLDRLMGRYYDRSKKAHFVSIKKIKRKRRQVK